MYEFFKIPIVEFWLFNYCSCSFGWKKKGSHMQSKIRLFDWIYFKLKRQTAGTVSTSWWLDIVELTIKPTTTNHRAFACYTASNHAVTHKLNSRRQNLILRMPFLHMQFLYTHTNKIIINVTKVIFNYIFLFPT